MAVFITLTDRKIPICHDVITLASYVCYYWGSKISNNDDNLTPILNVEYSTSNKAKR